MKWVFLGLLFVLLSGCQPWWNVEDDYDPTFENIQIPFLISNFQVREQLYGMDLISMLGYSFDSVSEIGVWLYYCVQYQSDIIHDENEYWQSPDQTFVWRTGDCEDLAVLMMYFIHKELGGWPQLVLGTAWGGGHSWVEYDGRWYEAQYGADITSNPNYVERETISYGVTMWRSMNTHKVIRGVE